MNTGMRKLNERGAVAAEFALLLPVFLLLLFGTIEFGMIMYGREIVTNAAREGARYGIVQRQPLTTKPDAGQIEQKAKDYLVGTGINQADVTFTPSGEQLAYPNNLTVTARYEYHWIVIPYLVVIVSIPNPLIITTQVVMLHE